MIGGFTFKGMKSSDFGIVVSGPRRPYRPKSVVAEFVIPRRPGSLRFDTRNYSMITIEVPVVVKNPGSNVRSMLRELGWFLSGRGRLVFDDEPGLSYDAMVDDEQVLTELGEFGSGVITFVAQPFAYSDTKTVQIHDGNVSVKYNGTADAPCTIILRNNTGSAIVNPTIKFTYRR